jgi:hypothetical protein
MCRQVLQEPQVGGQTSHLRKQAAGQTVTTNADDECKLSAACVAAGAGSTRR